MTKDWSVTIGAELMARYEEMLNEYLSVEDEEFIREAEFEKISATLESLEEMGADFGSIAA